MKLSRINSFAVTMALMLACYAHAQGANDASGSAPELATSSTAPATSSRKAGNAADRALRKRVLTALAKEKGLRPAGITVQARSGAILLEGWVPEQAQIDQATRVAQGVPGVTSVRSALTLSTF